MSIKRINISLDDPVIIAEAGLVKTVEVFEHDKYIAMYLNNHVIDVPKEVIVKLFEICGKKMHFPGKDE